jgi:hypothetical protein
VTRKAKIFADVDPKRPEPVHGDRDLCPYAEEFLEWAEALCDEHCRTLIKIAQAKVLLLDKYYDWRDYVHRSHRFHTGEQGHFCIFHVLDYAYRRLRLAELSLTGPMLFVPKPPPPAPPPSMPAGTILGLPE